VSPIARIPGQPSPVEVRDQLARLYREPQLSGLAAHHPARSSLLGQLGQALLQFLGAIFRAGGPHLWIPLGALLLAALAVGTLLVLRRPRGQLTPPPGQGAHAPEPSGRGPSPEALFQLSDQLAREGRPREAVRAAFQGLVAAGTASAFLHFEPSWTNSELLRAAAGLSGLQESLLPLVSDFDRVVYGGQSVDPAGCGEFTRSCRRTARMLA
jgi:hypothetical protein